VAVSLHLWECTLMAVLLGSPAGPRAQTLELQARLARERNPVQRAKIMQKLGAAEFKDIERDVSDDQTGKALRSLDQYRAEVQECSKGLDAAGLNAEKKPAGFKQLQFSVREALRRIDGILASLDAEQQVPFRNVRKDLDQLNRHLLQELFPRRQSPERPSPGS
jgi:hypothetical protein